VKEDWLYRRIYVDHYEETQLVLEHLVSGIHRLGRTTIPTARWFFIRYVDHRGLQVRLRHRAGIEDLAAFESATDAFLADKDSWPAALRRGYRGSVKSVYEPETTKYGGRGGVDRAERVFQDSSDLALSLAAEPEYWHRRFRYAACLTELTAGLLPPTTRTAFLYNIAWYWCGQSGPEAAADRHRVRTAAARSVHTLREGIHQLRHDAAYERLERHVALMAECLTGSRMITGRQPANLLFHMAHMNNNRLGIKPIEEAVIAEVLLGDVLAS